MYCQRCGRDHAGAVGIKIGKQTSADKLNTGTSTSTSQTTFDPSKSKKFDLKKIQEKLAGIQSSQATSPAIPYEPPPSQSAPLQPSQPSQPYEPPAYQTQPAPYQPPAQAEPAPYQPPAQAEPAPYQPPGPQPEPTWGPQPSAAKASDDTIKTILVGAVAALVVGTVLVYIAKDHQKEK